MKSTIASFGLLAAILLSVGCATAPCTLKNILRASTRVAQGSGAQGLASGLQGAVANGFESIDICEETDEPPTEEEKKALQSFEQKKIEAQETGEPEEVQESTEQSEETK